MDEDTHRQWDIIFKWFSLVAVLAGASWTVYKYRDDRRVDLDHQKQATASAEESRKHELNSYIFQHQATLYFDTARAAATIATTLGPKGENQKFMSAKTLNDARERFSQLYWGELVVVEDRRVELAMIAFQRCLLKKGVNCERVDVTQHNRPVNPDKLKAAGDATLQNLSLEIGACIRTSLEEERKIQFGQLFSAITDCPYD